MTVTALISLCYVTANGGQYSILLTKTDPTSATAAMDSLSELGYMPLRIEQHDALSAIVGGDYNLYLDALIDARILKSRGFVGQVYRKSSTAGNIPLKLPGVPSLVPPEEPISLDMDEQRRICLIVDSKPTMEAMQVLEFESASTSIDDPKNGYLALRLAYLHLRNKARSEAEVHLHKIVECKVAAPKDVWVESLNRLAHIKHAKAERLDAYKLYRILAVHALSDKQRDEALVEIAGLMLELVRSEKGTYEDFRLFCDDALQVVVSCSKRERVTLALMSAESYIMNLSIRRRLII